MSWNVFDQSLNVILAGILLYRVFHLRISEHYRAVVAYIGFEFLQSCAYLILRFLPQRVLAGFLDYRLFWSAERVIDWFITIWLVYSLLTATLKQLPGILRFSLGVLNVVFGAATAIALFTVRPEYLVSALSLGGYWGNWKVRVVSLVLVLQRAISFAELLSILAIMTFFLRFPVRVPRNLATLSIGLSASLFVGISLLLVRTYLPGAYPPMTWDPLSFISAACLTYWILSLNLAGEEAHVTLGRRFDSLPKERMVLQLEAMNAALLRSRHPS